MAKRKKRSTNPRKLGKAQRKAFPSGWVNAKVKKVGRSFRVKVTGAIAKKLRRAKR